jgi:DNA-binding HxlR family transcriptional regulator
MAPERSQPAATPGCEISELFHLLGKSHVMRILYLFLHEDPRTHRFVDVQKRLKLSPNTLTERLKELVAAGLLARTAYPEIPPRVDYVATQKAKDLGEVFASLAAWAKQHDLEPVPPARATA